MENRPPFPVSPLIRPSSLMHPFLSSKSSPLKRDANRILAPQSNHPIPPSHDVFNTGLLTPQGSQNTVDSDAARSLISPPPEDTAQAGSSRQSVRVNLRDLTFTHPPILDPSPHGPELVRSLPPPYVTSQTPAAHLNANDRCFPQSPRMRTAASINSIVWKSLVPIRNPVNRRVELAWSRMQASRALSSRFALSVNTVDMLSRGRRRV